MKTFLYVFISFCSLTLSSHLFADTMINGAGATFPSFLYTRWFVEYNRLHRDVKINYQPTGSGGGIRMLLSEIVDFAASDVPMTEEQMKHSRIPILHIPAAMGAIVITYNVPGVGNGLKLSADLIVDIFLGKIVSWNDPKILALNDIKIPDMPIMVIHRSDGSGTTAIFSSYLSRQNEEWKKSIGSGSAIKWPIGLGGKGNDGVAGLVKQNPGSIGYVELVYAEKNNLSFAFLKNKSGEFISPSSKAVTAGVQGIAIPEDLRLKAVEPDAKEAYPLYGVTYLLVPQTMPGPKGQHFVNFLRWANADGQKYLEALNYAPLPSEFLKKIGDKISSIKTEEALRKP